MKQQGTGGLQQVTVRGRGDSLVRQCAVAVKMGAYEVEVAEGRDIVEAVNE